MARTASLSSSAWLPSYGWWPHPGAVSASVIISPYHHAVVDEAEFEAVIRGYAGSREPAWEIEVEPMRMGDDRVITLTELDIPEPPAQGGILEVHTVRLDRQPKSGVAAIGMWIDAIGTDGGGYVIPTQPIRGAHKVLARDDVQVVPGLIATEDVETEVLLLNVIDDTVTVRFVASSGDGLVSEGKEFTIAPYSAWYGPVRSQVPRLRRLLQASDGVGSLSIYSNHRLLPHFGFRKNGGPVGCLDHTAPIFAN